MFEFNDVTFYYFSYFSLSQFPEKYRELKPIRQTIDKE